MFSTTLPSAPVSRVDLISEQLDAVDEDLDELEGYVYEDLDDCCDCDDCCDDDDEEYYDVECPNCGEIITVDRDILEEGSINCPKCDELLEFEIEVSLQICGCMINSILPFSAAKNSSVTP